MVRFKRNCSDNLTRMKINNYKFKIQRLWQQQSVKQVASLFSVNIVGIPLGVVTNIVVTKYLGSELFGDYKFICSIFNFAALIATFGFFQAGNRAIVISKNREKIQGLYAALLIILSILFVLMSFGLIFYTQNDNNIASKGLTLFFTCIIPMGFITLWSVLYETVLPADNQIGLLAKMRLYPKIANIIVICLLYFFANEIAWNKLLCILLLYNGSQLLMYLYIACSLKPTFKHWKANIKEIYKHNKSFGFNVYLGSLFAVGFGYFTEICISYFGANNVDVGFYSLALTFTQPLTLIPATIATTHYKSFANSTGISRKLLFTTITLSGLSLLALWILIPPFIEYCYGNDFLPVIGINYYVCIGAFFYGMGDFYNRFVQAKGCGARLRNASFIVGLTILLGNILFIPHYGAYGAAYARILTGIVYLLIIFYYYKKTISTPKAAKL